VSIGARLVRRHDEGPAGSRAKEDESMRFLVMVPANPESEAGQLPSKEMVEKMNALNEEMKKAGVLVELGGLQPSAKGVRLSFEKGKARVLDGPFAEAKELVAGFWLIDVKSREEAVAWISKAPFQDGVVIQLRPLHDLSSWPEELRKAAKLG
jgi:hypothetical protein